MIYQKIKCRLSEEIRRYRVTQMVKKNIKIEYKYNDFSILLPADHMLPLYQKVHKKYDKFLPHLVKYIKNYSTIIDVGANCGDTLAGMVDANKNIVNGK